MINIVELKRYLNIDIAENSKDEILQDCIDIAISEIENELNRKVTSGTYTQYSYSESADKLFIKNYPLRNLISCQYLLTDGTYTDVAEDINNILPIENYLLLVNSVTFPDSLIKTVYTSGYLITGDYGAPNDLKKVALEKASMNFFNSPQSKQARLGINSKSLGAQNTISETFKELDHTKILKKYKRINLD